MTCRIENKRVVLLAVEEAHAFIEDANKWLHDGEGCPTYTKQAGIVKARALLLRDRLSKVRKVNG